MSEQVLKVASLSFQLEIAQMKVKVSWNHIALPLVSTPSLFFLAITWKQLSLNIVYGFVSAVSYP